jgi:D-Tyr-tRNAtyr deacylase
MSNESNDGKTKSVRCLVQQCLKAKLQINAHEVNSEAKYVEIGRGCVLFLCFFKNSDESDVEKLGLSKINCFHYFN